MSDRISRRALMAAGGLTLAGRLVWPRAALAEGFAEIRMIEARRGAHVAFDPVGLLVEPGTTIRWVLESGVHTATAYHPANDRPLRIPGGAEPWESGYLLEPGARFELRLDVEGVYDYFCRPHEAAGMVGRIVVGRPAGPGAEPPGDDLPEAARAALPVVERVVERGAVRVGDGR